MVCQQCSRGAVCGGNDTTTPLTLQSLLVLGLQISMFVGPLEASIDTVSRQGMPWAWRASTPAEARAHESNNIVAVAGLMGYQRSVRYPCMPQPCTPWNVRTVCVDGSRAGA